MVERYFDPELKGKFEGIEKFLYEIISNYTRFMDVNNVPYTREDLVKCVNFLKCGVWDRYVSDKKLDLNLILKFENGDNILTAQIAKGGDKLIMLYFNGDHIDDLYESQINACEGFYEKGDSEEQIEQGWVRYLFVKQTAPNIIMPEEQKPGPGLENIMKNLKSLRDSRN